MSSIASPGDSSRVSRRGPSHSIRTRETALSHLTDTLLQAETLAHLLLQRADAQGHSKAYGFLPQGEAEAESISYQDLRLRAARLAGLLARRYPRGSRVVLAFPAGLEFIVAFFGCILAGMIAVPVSLPKRNRPNLRFRSILGDSEADCILTLDRLRSLMEKATSQQEDFTHLDCLASDGPEAASADEPSNWPQLASQDIAYLQYTSGSISTPKGVIVTHANVLSNSEFIRFVEENDEGSLSLTWLPHFHDMGLVEGIVQPLFSGFAGLIMPPVAFFQKPLRWLRSISDHAVSNSGGPNFAYELCLRHITNSEAQQLDLSSWKVAYNGAEMIRPATLARFAKKFAPSGFEWKAFYPVYGLAEATLVVASGRRESEPVGCCLDRDQLEKGRVAEAGQGAPGGYPLSAAGLIQAGRFESALEVSIVDPQTLRPLGDDHVGEIWIRGGSVAQGYWNRPQETRESFAAWTADPSDGPFLRTGDLGFRRGRHLFLTGRLKELIIVQGRNLYPQDLERLAESADEAVRPLSTAAFALEARDCGERVIVVCEVKRAFRKRDLEPAADRIAQAISGELDLDLAAAVFISPGTLPKTSSGKIQRLLCRRRLAEGTLKTVFRKDFHHSRTGPDRPSSQRASEPQLLDALRRKVAHRLGMSAREIETSVPIGHYVHDSLTAVRLSHDIEQAFGCALPLSRLIGSSSLEELASDLEKRSQETHRESEAQSAAQPDPMGSRLPLTPGQESLWFLHKMAPSSAAYNICRLLEITGPLKAEALRRALDSVIARHGVLRTRFHEADGIVEQSFDSIETIDFRFEEAQGRTHEEVRRSLLRTGWAPFELGTDSLIRVGLVDCGGERHLLLVSAHHIVMDLWSFTVFLRDWLEAYRALARGQWPSLGVDDGYPRHVQRRIGRSREADWASHRGFWQERLKELEGPMALPLDRPRGAVQTFRGGIVDFALDEKQLSALLDAAAASRTTLFTAILSSFLIWLHRLSGQESIVVGVPTSGRDEAEFAQTIGYFVNPLAVRSDLSHDLDWTALVEKTRDSLILSLEHQEAPFTQVAEWVRTRRDARHSPVFQVLFGLEEPLEMTDLAPLALGRAGGAHQLDELMLASLDSGQEGAQFDLNLMMVRHRGRLLARLSYNADLFDASTIRRWVGNFKHLLDSALEHPERPIAHLEALPAPEADEVLHRWNSTQEEFAEAAPLPWLVDRQAQRTPDRIALSMGEEQLTYERLSRLTDALAHRLTRSGVSLESQVAVCLDRSIELTAALVGILKCGASYLPIGTDYPAPRIAQFFQAAGPRVVISQAGLQDRFKGLDVEFIDAQDALRQEAVPSETSPRPRIQWENAAYTIFTSGSTGAPKGVVNTHGGIVNRLLWMQSRYQLGAGDSVLQKTPYTFDVSVWEFFWPLICGARLVMPRPGGHQDPQYLRRTIEAEQVTLLHFVPSMLDAFLREPSIESLTSVRQVVCSGEALSSHLQARFWDRWDARLDNLYGPTEAAVDVTAWSCDRQDDSRSVPIGFPISNTQIYLLDPHLNPLPRGASGMLHIGGRGLARGYVGRPDLTAGSFLPNPYSSAKGERMYAAGDCARHRTDGAIEFLGRRDHQVKIRGVRIELEEIESCLRAHPSVLAAVAVAHRSAQGHARLAAYVQPRTGQSPSDSELRTWLAERIPQAMVPQWLLSIPQMPLLENGKIDRKALPRPKTTLEDRNRPFLQPRTPQEVTLAEIWKQVLELPQVSVNDGFFDLGGDSLLVVRVAAMARERGLSVSVEQIYQAQTIERIAALSRPGPLQPADGFDYQPFSLVAAKDRALLPAEIDDAMPLSRLQEGMVYHIDNSENYIAYVASVHLKAEYRSQLMQAAVERIFRRHPYLRISFDYRSCSQPLQLVHCKIDPLVEVEDLRRLTPQSQESYLRSWLEREKKRRFEWDRPPLVRFSLHLRSPDSFQITIAEVTLDGWSIAVLLSELCRSYRSLLRGVDDDSAGPEIPYGRFVRLEQEACESQEHRSFWRNLLKGQAYGGKLPRWPLARRSDDAQIHSRRTLGIEQRTLSALQQLARRIECPLKSVFLASHLRVVAFLSGRTRILTELISNGRLARAGGDLSIGLFTNTVPMCLELKGGSWIDLIRRTARAEQELIPYRRYPFARIRSEFGRQPLFETAFNYTHFHVYRDLLEASPDFEILDVRSFDQTYFYLTAYFNLEMLQEGFSIDLDYDPKVVADDQIEAIAGYYKRVLEAMATAPESSFRQVTLLSAEERRLLAAWSGRDRPEPATALVVDRFEAQARRNPDASAVAWDDSALTYFELKRRSDLLAQHLRRLGADLEVRVGLLAERSPHTIVALLGILKSGAAFVPLDPQTPPERLRFILGYSEVRILVAEKRDRQSFTQDAERVLFLDGVEWDSQPEALRAWAPFPQNAAYAIYTSGATGRPKGVVVSHLALAAFVDSALETYPIRRDDRVVQFATLSFDAALEEIFPTLLAGGVLVLKSERMAQGFDGFLCESRRQQATVWDLPTAFWHHLIDRLEDDGEQHLKGLRLLIIGGEKALAARAARWLQLAGNRVELLNTYGPTEATVVATRFSVQAAQDLRLPQEEVPIGRPLPHMRAFVLDPSGRSGPVARKGELHLGGIGLARGYQGRPDLTACAFLPDDSSGAPSQRLYRTGDWARWLPDGSLEFSGRQDAQIKLRGFRVEPGEIEQAILEIPAIAQVAVAALAGPEGAPVLSAVVVPEAADTATGGLIRELREFLRSRLPSYMIPARFAIASELPMTLAGKLDRDRLAQSDWSSERAAEPNAAEGGENPIESIIAAILRKRFQLDSAGPETHFLDIGGDSLSAMHLASQLKSAFGIEVGVPEIFQHPTVRSLAQHVAQARLPDHPQPEPIRAGSAQEERPLSLAQERLWFLHQFRPGNTSYNVAAAFRIEGTLEVGALQSAFREIVRRHQVLRARFVDRGARPELILRQDSDIDLRLHDLGNLPDPERRKRAEDLAHREASRPFDLEKDDLIRVTLVRLRQREFELIVLMHHIVTDEWCAQVFLNELRRFYESALSGQPHSLPELSFQYWDFARWQRNRLLGGRLEALRAFWAQRLQGHPPRIELPYDRPRTNRTGDSGRRMHFSFDKSLLQDLKALSLRQEATLFMTLLALYKVLFFSFSGQRDLLIGSPVTGRTQPGTEGLIGFFANLVVMRSQLREEMPFEEFLRDVRETALAAYDHQEYSFAQLVSDLNPERSDKHAPIVQVIFGLWGQPVETAEFCGLRLSQKKLHNQGAKYDLEMQLVESDGRLQGFLEYNTGLFEERTIRRLVAAYTRLAQAAAQAPQMQLGRLARLSRPETEANEVMKPPQSTAFRGKSPLKNIRRKAISVSRESMVESGPLSADSDLPLLVKPSVSGLNLSEWIDGSRDWIESRLIQHGGILFRGFKIDGLEGFQQLARNLGPELLEYKERSTPRTELGKDVYTSTEYPAHQTIPQHNENSYASKWPLKVAFFCQQPSLGGGETPLADSRLVYAKLSSELRQPFVEKGVLYVRNFGLGVDLSWQDAFQTSDPDQVEAYCRQSSIEFEWLDGGKRLRTRQKRPAVARHPQTGDWLWFNQAHLFNVASLDEATREALLSTYAEMDLPRQTFLGDGSAIEPWMLEQIENAYSDSLVMFPWQQGDLLLLDNMLISHGRRPYEGPRKVLVAMAQVWDQV